MMTDADYENMPAFSCGVDELDKFFLNEVKECVERRYLSAYCAFTESQGIVAVFTLMNDALMISDQAEKEDFIDDLKLELNQEIVDFFNRQSSYPAINIGHLGVSVNYQNKRIGTKIIDFVAYTFALYRQAGCQFITVDAINKSDCNKFYFKNGFCYQTNRDSCSATRRMYRIL